MFAVNKKERKKVLHFAELRHLFTWCVVHHGPLRALREHPVRDGLALISPLSQSALRSASCIGIALVFLYLLRNTLFLSSLVKADVILFQPSLAH